MKRSCKDWSEEILEGKAVFWEQSTHAMDPRMKRLKSTLVRRLVKSRRTLGFQCGDLGYVGRVCYFVPGWVIRICPSELKILAFGPSQHGEHGPSLQ